MPNKQAGKPNPFRRENLQFIAIGLDIHWSERRGWVYFYDHRYWLKDDRGGRREFPPSVHSEESLLSVLQEHFYGAVRLLSEKEVSHKETSQEIPHLTEVQRRQALEELNRKSTSVHTMSGGIPFSGKHSK